MACGDCSVLRDVGCCWLFMVRLDLVCSKVAAKLGSSFALAPSHPQVTSHDSRLLVETITPRPQLCLRYSQRCFPDPSSWMKGSSRSIQLEIHTLHSERCFPDSSSWMKGSSRSIQLEIHTNVSRCRHPFTKSEFSSIHTLVSNSAVMHPITSTVLIFNLLINLIKPKIDKQETTESYHFW